MATFTKRGRRWRVQIQKAGKRYSSTHATKAEAVAWAAEFEQRRPGKAPVGATVGRLLDEYRDKVTPTKRGARAERLRIGRIMRDPLADVLVEDVGQSDIAAWRDRRLKQVSAASVLREWNVISAAFSAAINEWQWLAAHPMKGVRKPDKPLPRNRRISDDELEAIYHACGYEKTAPPYTVTARVGAAVRFAVATAMRAGEIVNLRWDDIDGKVARLRQTKTVPREVPLFPDALAVIEQLRDVTTGYVFGLRSSQLDALFRKARDRAMLADLHFHDTRGEALTRLSKRFDVLTLAKISGHKDLRILHAHYYRESAADIADREQ